MAAIMNLSLPQLSYLQTSLSSHTPIRPDSRSLTQFRPITFASSVLPGCLGSVHLSWGPFSILVGVKGQIITASEPSIECNVEVQGERDDDPLSTLLSDTFNGILSAVDLSELTVAKERSWELSVDAVLMSRDSSSPVPAMSLAIRLALLDTRVPRTTPSESQEGIGAGDFDVDDDYGSAVPIKAAARVPLLTLVNHIGPNIIFDASPEEEAIVTSRYIVAVTESGEVLSLRNLDVKEPRHGLQDAKDRHGMKSDESRRGLQEAIDVSLEIFRHLRTHVEEPIDLFEVL